MTASPITHVRYAAQAVPDFKAAVDFYSGAWGLKVVESDSDVAFLAAEGSEEAYVLRLRRAEDKHLDLLSFGVGDAATVDRLAAEFIAADVQMDRQPGQLDTPGGGYGFRAFDPDGRLIEISAAVQPRKARTPELHEAIPTGLSHVVINSPNILQTMAFYQQRLGFVLSDWLADFMCFLRIGDEHHVLAIASAPHTSFNHVAYEVSSVDDYMRATGRMMRVGTPLVWGPGRHGPGANTFSYFVDPNGNVTEYTSDMEVIEDSDMWTPRVYAAGPMENDQWGTGGLIEEFLPYAMGQPDPHLWTPSPI